MVIKKHDELLESLQAIIEFFRIAIQNCGKTDVAFVCGGTLQRRKSRSVLNVSQTGGIPR